MIKPLNASGPKKTDKPKGFKSFGRWLRSLMLLALVPVWLAAVSVASGHAQLVRSEPENGQALEQSPEKVMAWFAEELESGSSEMQVLDAQGDPIDNGDGGLDLNDLDHKTMIVTLPPDLPASTYTVHWVAVSAEDGDLVEGDFVFDVGLVSTSGQPSPRPETGTMPALWILIGLTAAVLAAAGTAAIFVRRRHQSRPRERVATQDGHA